MRVTLYLLMCCALSRQLLLPRGRTAMLGTISLPSLANLTRCDLDLMAAASGVIMKFARMRSSKLSVHNITVT